MEEYGFFLAANGIIKDQTGHFDEDDFVDMYDNFNGDDNMYLRNPKDAIFISSDTALHLYHILIDRSFQRMEETKFQPMLRLMTRALFHDSINKYNTVQDEELKDSYKRLSAYYLIPLLVLNKGTEDAKLDIKPEDYETFAKYLEAMNEQRIENSKGELEFSDAHGFNAGSFA